ncbi:MAG: hypothetical protein IJN25_10275 [Clostridia bacterium]|nr:hypothetical protein [Oscillospiraceae bacterium]MBQ7034027.1 hypothetical protein [Clostridia bacterium]
MAVASLVLGIVSLVFSLFFSALGWPALLCGVLGIILGAIAKKKPGASGMATAGLVLSIISVALGVICWIACAACIGSLL